MKMRESEIFNAYLKTAQEMGLLSDEPVIKEAADKSRNDLSDIELLYGISPDGKKSKDILEEAHPETAIIGSAYDAMNAVVENLNQRQSIMTHIALKTPNGKTVQRRYVEASNELLNTLISTGFELDNNDEPELMKLADSCAERINKVAIGPLALIGWIAAGIGSVSGLGYYFTQAGPLIQNIEENAKILLNEISDLKNKSYSADLIKLVEHIRSLNNKFIKLLSELSSIQRKIQNAFIKNDLNEIVAIQNSAQPKVDAIFEIINQLEGSKSQLGAFKANVESEKDSDVEDQWVRKIKVVWDFAVGTADDDVIKAIESLSGAINKAVNNAKAVVSSVNSKYSNQIENKLTEMQKEIDPEFNPIGDSKPVPENVSHQENYDIYYKNL